MVRIDQFYQFYDHPSDLVTGPHFLIGPMKNDHPDIMVFDDHPWHVPWPSSGSSKNDHPDHDIHDHVPWPWSETMTMTMTMIGSDVPTMESDHPCHKTMMVRIDIFWPTIRFWQVHQKWHRDRCIFSRSHEVWFQTFHYPPPFLTPPPSWFRSGPIRHRLHHGFRCHVPPWVIKSDGWSCPESEVLRNGVWPTFFAIPIKSYFLLAPPTFIETSRFWWKPRFWYHGRNHEKHEKWSNRALLYIYIYRIGGKREKHRFRPSWPPPLESGARTKVADPMRNVT